MCTCRAADFAPTPCTRAAVLHLTNRPMMYMPGIFVPGLQ